MLFPGNDVHRDRGEGTVQILPPPPPSRTSGTARWSPAQALSSVLAPQLISCADARAPASAAPVQAGAAVKPPEEWQRRAWVRGLGLRASEPHVLSWGRRPRSWGFVLAAFYGPGQAPASLSEPGFLPGLMGGRLELSGFQSPSRLEDSMTLNFQKGRSHRGRFGAARVCGYNPLRVAVIMTLCSQHLRGTNLILATIPRGQYDSETHFTEEKIKAQRS